MWIYTSMYNLNSSGCGIFLSFNMNVFGIPLFASACICAMLWTPFSLCFWWSIFVRFPLYMWRSGSFIHTYSLFWRNFINKMCCLWCEMPSGGRRSLFRFLLWMTMPRTVSMLPTSVSTSTHQIQTHPALIHHFTVTPSEGVTALHIKPNAQQRDSVRQGNRVAGRVLYFAYLLSFINPPLKRFA